MTRRALNVSEHPDGYLVRVMRGGRTHQEFHTSFSKARAAAKRLRDRLPRARPGRRTDLERKRRRGAQR